MSLTGIDALTRILEHVTTAPDDLLEYAQTLEAGAPKLALALLGRPELPDVYIDALYERTTPVIGTGHALAHLVLRDYRRHGDPRHALDGAVAQIAEFRQARSLALVSALYDMFPLHHPVICELPRTPDLALMTAVLDVAAARRDWGTVSAGITELASRQTQNLAVHASERELAVLTLQQMAQVGAPGLTATLGAVRDVEILTSWLQDPSWPWAYEMTTQCADDLLARVIIPQLTHGDLRMDDRVLASSIATKASWTMTTAALTELQFIQVRQGGFLRTDFLDYFAAELNAHLHDLEARCPVPLASTLERVPREASEAVADWLVERLPAARDRWRTFAMVTDALTTGVTLQDLTSVTGAVLAP